MNREIIYTVNLCLECGKGSKIPHTFNGIGPFCLKHHTYEFYLKHHALIKEKRKKKKTIKDGNKLAKAYGA